MDSDWWFGTFLFFHISGIIIPTDYFFSEGLKPPTRILYDFIRSVANFGCFSSYSSDFGPPDLNLWKAEIRREVIFPGCLHLKMWDDQPHWPSWWHIVFYDVERKRLVRMGGGVAYQWRNHQTNFQSGNLWPYYASLAADGNWIPRFEVSIHWLFWWLNFMINIYRIL